MSYIIFGEMSWKVVLEVNSELIIQKTYKELCKNMCNISYFNVFTDSAFLNSHGRPLSPPTIPMNQVVLEEYLLLLLKIIPSRFIHAETLTEKIKFLKFYKLIFTLPIYYKNNFGQSPNSESMCFYNKCSNLDKFLGISIANNSNIENETEQLLFNMSLKLREVEKMINENLLEYSITDSINVILDCLHSMLMSSQHSRLNFSNFANKNYKLAFVYEGLLSPVVKFFHYAFMGHSFEMLETQTERLASMDVPKISKFAQTSTKVVTFPGLHIKGTNMSKDTNFTLGVVEVTRYTDLNQLVTESELLKELLLQMCCCKVNSCILTDSQNYILIKIPKELNPKLLLNAEPPDKMSIRNLKDAKMRIDLDILCLRAEGSFFQLDSSNNMKKLFKITTEKTTPMLLLLLEMYQNYQNYEINAKDTRLQDLARVLSIHNIKTQL